MTYWTPPCPALSRTGRGRLWESGRMSERQALYRAIWIRLGRHVWRKATGE